MEVYTLPHEPLFCIDGEEVHSTHELPHERFFCIGGEVVRRGNVDPLASATVPRPAHRRGPRRLSRSRRLSLEARGKLARHLHGRRAQPLRVLLVVGRAPCLRRRVPHGERGRLERRVRVVPRAQEGDKGRTQLFRRERHASVLLEHGLDQLGPLRRAQWLRSVGAGHEDVRLLRGARALTLQHDSAPLVLRSCAAAPQREVRRWRGVALVCEMEQTKGFFVRYLLVRGRNTSCILSNRHFNHA